MVMLGTMTARSGETICIIDESAHCRRRDCLHTTAGEVVCVLLYNNMSTVAGGRRGRWKEGRERGRERERPRVTI